MQRFYWNTKTQFNNGAIGHGSNSPMDCLGPFAKVSNCPIKGISKRYTCYATGDADTAFSIPAITRINGEIVKGYFSYRGHDSDDEIFFTPYRGQILPENPTLDDKIAYLKTYHRFFYDRLVKLSAPSFEAIAQAIKENDEILKLGIETVTKGEPFKLAIRSIACMTNNKKKQKFVTV